MSEPFDDVATIARLLPGRWVVKATNLPDLVSGERRDPAVSFELVRENPLALAEYRTYRDPEGRERMVAGGDRWHGDGFTWRASGIRGLLVRGHWEVAGLRDPVAVLRFAPSPVTAGGVDVMIREGADAGELRRVVAANPRVVGLRLHEFASLTWLDHLPPHD
ncbi:MAG: hypothetical protein R2717_04055 [Schumannella sp.]